MTWIGAATLAPAQPPVLTRGTFEQALAWREAEPDRALGRYERNDNAPGAGPGR